MHRYYRPLLAAVLILSFSGPADAQRYMSFGYGAPSYRESPEVNLYLSARYDWLLRTTINIPPLHGDCIISFDQYEPVLRR